MHRKESARLLPKELAQAGAAVAVNYSADREGAERTVLEITRRGGKAVAIQGDVSKAADVKRLFAETGKASGSIDVLVNNAGVFRFEAIEEVAEEEFHREFDINVLATILATQEALKYFPRTGGSIINISSIASENRVNAVAPGLVDTEGNRSSGFVGSPAGDAGAAAIPLGARFGRPEEVAPVVVFLASHDAAWITGERISASGGLH